MSSLTTKIKTTPSTSTVTFTNISGSYYDMIISIQSTTINQTISMKDTEGNDITEQPIILTRSVKIILKDQKIGSMSFSDANSYTIIISYSVKREASGIPYIDFDYSTANTYNQIVNNPNIYVNSFKSQTVLTPVPQGKMWKIKSISLSFEASTTATYVLFIIMQPPSQTFLVPVVTNVISYSTLAVTSSDTYDIYYSVYATDLASTDMGSSNYTSVFNLPHPIELYYNWSLYIQSDEPTNGTSINIIYTEEDAI